MPAYMDNKTKTWYCKFNYSDWRGESHQKMKRGFKTKREALAYEAEFKTKDQLDEQTSFLEICQRFISENTGILKNSTLQTYRTAIKSHIEPFWGAIPFCEIDKTNYLKWREWLQKSNKSFAYIQKAETQFRTLYNFGLVELDAPPTDNFLKKVKKLKNNEPRKEMQIWTYEEYCRFMEQVDEPDLYFVFALLYNSGIRLGELMALTGADFDLASHTLHINKSLRREYGVDIVTVPKTSKSNRNITLPSFLFELFDEYTKTLPAYSPKNRLFTFTKRRLYSGMNRYSASANIKRIRIHDLRHSHASFLIDQGFNPVLVSERLGHAKVSITLNYYSHLFSGRDVAVADSLENMYQNRIKK